MVDSIISAIDYVGYQGPIITSLFTFFSLLGKPAYLFAFIIGSFLNHSLNSTLKTMIKEPRPKNPLPYIDDGLIKGAHIYGMPSGHAQIVAFAVSFLIFTKNPLFLIIVSLYIGILTLIQRWKFRRHSVEQLVAGSIVGTLFSYCMFWITETYLQRTSTKSLF